MRFEQIPCENPYPHPDSYYFVNDPELASFRDLANSRRRRSAIVLANKYRETAYWLNLPAVQIVVVFLVDRPSRAVRCILSADLRLNPVFLLTRRLAVVVRIPAI